MEAFSPLQYNAVCKFPQHAFSVTLSIKLIYSNTAATRIAMLSARIITSINITMEIQLKCI